MVLSVLTVIVCLGFPFVSRGVVIPYLSDTFGTVETMALSENNMIIMVIMIAVLILLFAFLFGRTTKKIVPIYMAGVNTGDDLTFIDSMEGKTAVSLRNWYMEGYFGEFKMNVIGVITTGIVLVVAIGMVGGAMLGGM